MGTWFQKIKNSLSKTSSKLTSGFSDLLTKRKLDQGILDELEEILIQGDLGITVSSNLIQQLKKERFNQEVSTDEVKEFLSEKISMILNKNHKDFALNLDQKPCVILMVGVNGSGKTTTIAKLSEKFKSEGLRVSCVAGDTFRAAATQQLNVWGDRIGIQIVAGETGEDPASVIYKGLENALDEHHDVLIVDTAGRLQNNQGLMDELSKIYKVIHKRYPFAPQEVLLILDATVGQNAYSQIELFSKATHVTGLVIAKMDSSAKGGVVIGLAEKYNLPIYFIGTGEGSSDLHPFDVKSFVDGLLDIKKGDDL